MPVNKKLKRNSSLSACRKPQANGSSIYTPKLSLPVFLREKGFRPFERPMRGALSLFAGNNIAIPGEYTSTNCA